MAYLLGGTLWYGMSSLVSRNFIGPAGQTSLRLEPELWDGLVEVCQREEWSRSEMIAVARAAYRDRRTASAVRTYLVVYFRAAAAKKIQER